MNACESASTWSSFLPFGKAAASSTSLSAHGANGWPPAIDAGRCTLPACTSGDTADARAYFDPCGSSGTMLGTVRLRAGMIVGPFALSSTSLSSTWGYRADRARKAWQVAVNDMRSRTWSRRSQSAPRRNQTGPTT